MKFQGSNVLITGASKGIGAQIAKTLAGYGLKVWINYRSKPELADNLQKEIESSGGKAAVIKFDASVEEEFVSALKVIIESDGKLDYLVNNAGITNDKLALRMSIGDFESVIDANLKSCFIGCREALKIMGKQRFGSVVNIASVIGERGNMGQSNYAASKGGMIAMSKSFAYEGAPRNIRFNCITPGFIKSDMTDELKPEIVESYMKNIPLARFGEASDVAEAVAFLLSNQSSYITGEVLKVNGGLYM
ncbi:MULTISPECIES: 3-oxoacyl-ACP reductase FabG [Helicobacter]|uniref:3-oxoacyl-[acyl-carrier-protein] reductase n=6 Tax=Helicobacter typhlonius TaxID=76936 RepID=A0A099UD33_9HELI|nr:MULTISPECIES: 3-oxoacyl-ACP reductase FabG [Helicobacter]TLD79534.1 3-oxoacyl-ACP reductase FabG [Helicobacter typhlonius]TLD88357.1 3-oxoacyl-ACP reductase FabG [Helicobacter sp. MIT 03-1616]CUU39345.1 3-oxoacyl-[acyl-carrier protein] reductase [Helicobacter typhlonius]HCD73749.1 3-oxoacyl-ACP reductase FabG [Helicobacter sp.]